jgi:hypothetical protein
MRRISPQQFKDASPQQFKDAFLQADSTFQSEIFDCWGNWPERTHIMLKTVSPAIAQILNVNVYPGDYYTLDSIYYTERDTEHFPETSYHAKNICVALEHENNITRSVEEMNKLQLFNTPLKVLITYNPHASERAAQLARYTKILENADVFGDFATLRRQMVIFGDKQEAKVHWQFYVYETTGFQEMRNA